ncbi:hypothetical protein X777_08308, partial [Ooceraea biroi]
EPEIVALHLPDRRRREVDSQDRKSNCKKDEDCGPGAICFAHLTCDRDSRNSNSIAFMRAQRTPYLVSRIWRTFMPAESVMRRRDETVGSMFITIGLTKERQSGALIRALAGSFRPQETGAGNRSSLEGTHNACQDAIPRYHPHCLSEPPSALLRVSSVTTDCGLTSAVSTLKRARCRPLDVVSLSLSFSTASRF